MRVPALPAELIDGLGVTSATPVSGGDICAAYRLRTASGLLFLKTHQRPGPDLFAREAAGLRMLRAHAPEGLGVPAIVRESSRGLVLEWIEQSRGARTDADERGFGRALAQLHRTTSEDGTFGAVDGSLAGYLGSVEADLTPTSDWAQFFWERRVRPLAAQAIALNRLSPRAQDLVAALTPRVAQLCGPEEPPALLHGDLWAGNRLVGPGGRSWLIDPACHWGHREYDLAMMQLFGGFGPGCFRAYDEEYPLAPGWADRVPWYQLPPLLVHAILFGGGYGDAAWRVLTRYA